MNKCIWFIGLYVFLMACEKDLPLHAEGFGSETCATSSNLKMEKAVILVLGQSNAANHGESRYTASCHFLSNFYGIHSVL